MRCVKHRKFAHSGKRARFERAALLPVAAGTLLILLLAAILYPRATPAPATTPPSQRPNAVLTSPVPQLGSDKGFLIRAADSNLTGTVLLVLRGTTAQYQPSIVEIDRRGKVVWRYELPAGSAAPTEARKLPNGNIIYINAPRSSDATSFIAPAVTKHMVEIDYTSQQVLRTVEVKATHHLELLPNGNFLTVDAARSLVSEISPSGSEIWSWSAGDSIKAYGPDTFVGATPESLDPMLISNMYFEYRRGVQRQSWTHPNSAQRLDNGNTIISLRNLDLVLEVDAQKKAVRSYGALILKHQHCAWQLDNGNLLIADNGNGRVIEVDQKSQQIVWEYAQDLNLPTQGCAVRLPSGNTLITDSSNLRILEVTPGKQIAWELKIDIPDTRPLYRAFWYP